MRDRLKSSKRILAVQTQLVKLAEWKLNTLKRQTAELQADQERLQEFVSHADSLSPLLSAAAFKRGKSLQTALVKSQAGAAKQVSHTDAMKRKEKLAENFADRMRAAADSAAEKRQLEETIEAASWTDDASFP
ncbi:MAG: hypothetical protein P4L76_18255 [Beijerinckiaceae bacterium]|nr:hypothetical protein [Beijerinckiaceae bacterium]